MTSEGFKIRAQACEQRSCGLSILKQQCRDESTEGKYESSLCEDFYLMSNRFPSLFQI